MVFSGSGMGDILIKESAMFPAPDFPSTSSLTTPATSPLELMKVAPAARAEV
jgi:hypothetical protein